MSPRMNSHRQHPSRRGFSLIELMIVIVIISLLVALILPAIGTVRGTVRTAEVSTDIKALETAAAQFKEEFGMYPPSRIVLYEAATGDPSWAQHGASGSTTDAQRVQSRTLIQRMWPQFDFTLPRDLNNDMNATGVVTLTGDECLVFFLGGLQTAQSTGQAATNGFSQNPTNPFVLGGNRTGPFHEFDPNRLIDIDGDLYRSYADAFHPATIVPYLYFSSYDGQGYRMRTDGGTDRDSDGVPDLATVIDGSPVVNGYSVYMQQDMNAALPSDADPIDSYTPEPGEVPWNKDSFQIISAGLDGRYGCGGIWSDDDGIVHSPASLNVLNVSEARDNITNFSGGTLE